jgi:hypothetical protein
LSCEIINDDEKKFYTIDRRKSFGTWLAFVIVLWMLVGGLEARQNGKRNQKKNKKVQDQVTNLETL